MVAWFGLVLVQTELHSYLLVVCGCPALQWSTLAPIEQLSQAQLHKSFTARHLAQLNNFPLTSHPRARPSLRLQYAQRLHSAASIRYPLAFVMMMAAPDGYYTFTGREGEVIPRNATRVRIHESVTVIPARAFEGNPNLEEVDFHIGVKKVKEWAFRNCPSLRRAIMPGVEAIDRLAFYDCKALAYVEFGKLEIIEDEAFEGCESLGSINLPYARIVNRSAFSYCTALTNVEFSDKLELTRGRTFAGCTSLERITIPLKDDMITSYELFQGCENLKHVELVAEGGVHDTIAALLLEEWKNDMNAEINSIDQILSDTPAGDTNNFFDVDDGGGKARAIQRWIRAVLRKIIQYKAQHQHVLEEAAATLKLALPQDTVMNNVLPFLELPSYTFELGDHEDEEDDSDNEDDVDDFDDDESFH
eukprot:scaffold14691_cov152-Skeletonema_dohrnii-CCMP3373.AAC.9